jgi:tetratricopeptide (TPR) repeat protein
MMTGAVCRSFFVAALFALHPLHVESVAWVAERKDVLSGLFWILTILAYIRYAKSPRFSMYFSVVLFFVLGLMSKAMLVTLPFVLVLLDYWPLGRFRDVTQGKLTLRHLVCEKLPLIFLAATSSVVNFMVQQSAGAMIRGESYSFITRISNALVCYVWYIVKLVYPSKLAVLYPHPGDSLPLWRPVLALALLLLITTAVICKVRKRPYLLVGWLWYLGTLVPVIGFVQVGSQAMADRYTYLPAIGIFIMAGWGGAEFFPRLRHRKVIGVLTISVVVTVLLICTRFQLRHWRNSLTLFEHTLSVTENNYVIHNNYGCSLHDAGKLESAEENFNESLRIKPDYVGALNNLGMVLKDLGRIEEAVIKWRRALELSAYHPSANANLGLIMFTQGKYDEAIKHFKTTLSVKPNFSGVHYFLGDIYYQKENYGLAVEYFNEAIRVQPYNILAMNNLGMVLKEQGKINEAVDQWNKILEIAPNHLYAHLNIALAMGEKGDYESAIKHYVIALQLKPDAPALLDKLAISYSAVGKLSLAIETAEKALKLAEMGGKKKLAEEIRKRLELYRAGQSYSK